MSEIYFDCPNCYKEISIDIDGSQKQGYIYKEVCEKCKEEFEYYYELSIDIYPNKINNQKGGEQK